MPSVANRAVGRAAFVLIAAAGLFAGFARPALAIDATVCRFLSQLPDDCGRAEQRRFNNLRDQRYEEIDLFAKDVLRKGLYQSAYNTTGLNGSEDSQDSAPQSIAGTLTPQAIAKQYQAALVVISPPRRWTIDWLADRVGNVRSFGGLNAAWMGDRPAPNAMDTAKPAAKAYRPMVLPRTAVEGFKKGSKIYLLDDPKDRTWVMRSYTDKDLKDLTIDGLDGLGDRLALPAGWKFRVAVLPKELILEPKSGLGVFIEDDKENLYDLTGEGKSNFRP